MSNDLVSLIEKLPVELLHRIFDHLDVETILFSIRPVCRLFQSLVNTYNRYILDLKLISKSTFYLLCRLIDPKNVISLTLSNDERTSNQIRLFISLVCLEQFTRLHSLTLLDIDESLLNLLLTKMNFNFLNSFSFSMEKFDNRRRKQTLKLLSSILTQPTVQKFEFNIYNNEYNMNSLFTIFQCTSYLHTLIMKNISIKMIENLNSTYFQQLRSLTIDDLRVTIDTVESFLLLTSSIIYLKLIGGENMIDGKRWEQFITKHLSQLNRFEFYFEDRKDSTQIEEDLKLIISSFETPFWIEHKKWMIICEYPKQYPDVIYLYSIPICKSSLKYQTNSEKILLSTYPIMNDMNRIIMNNINSLSLVLTKELADDMQNQITITNHPLFDQVRDIDLYFTENWPLLSLQNFSVFIDIAKLIRIDVYSFYFDTYNQNTWMDIFMFMEQAHNLSSLRILGTYLSYKLNETIVNIYSNLPRHIKYLEILINDVEQIKIILERCKNLSIIKFFCDGDKKFRRKVVNWFDRNTINTTIQENRRLMFIWLGKLNIQSIEINIDHKRIKFSDSLAD